MESLQTVDLGLEKGDLLLQHGLVMAQSQQLILHLVHSSLFLRGPFLLGALRLGQLSLQLFPSLSLPLHLLFQICFQSCNFLLFSQQPIF